MLLGQIAADLFEGHQIGQHLARVGAIRQRVDHWLLRRSRQLQEVLVRAQARDHSVHVLIEDAGRVGHRLAKAELHVLPGEGRGRPAEAGDPDLE